MSTFYTDKQEGEEKGENVEKEGGEGEGGKGEVDPIHKKIYSREIYRKYIVVVRG